MKSDCEPPVQLSVALETFLEEVKLELASIEFDKPKDNISTGERQAVKELPRIKSIILKKSDKGKHHRIDEQTGQTNEGQILLDDLNNYRPLDKPIDLYKVNTAILPGVQNYWGERAAKQ